MGELIASAGRWLPGSAFGARMPLRWWLHTQVKRPFFGRFMKPWRWPAGVDETGWERTRIASRSHSSLAAVVRETAAPVRGVVVCAHPMGLAAKGFWLRNGHAQRLLDLGYHVVAFDYNGFGESPATNFDYVGDVLSVGRWARQRWPRLPLHAYCASFGGISTLGAMLEPDYPFEAVVADSVPPTLPDFWKAYPVAQAVLRACQLVRPSLERRLRPELALARLPEGTRLLLVHSRGDRWTPPSHGERLLRAARPGSDVVRLTLERSEHTHGLRDEPEAYWPAVVRFLATLNPVSPERS